MGQKNRWHKAEGYIYIYKYLHVVTIVYSVTVQIVQIVQMYNVLDINDMFFIHFLWRSRKIVANTMMLFYTYTFGILVVESYYKYDEVMSDIFRRQL